MRLFKWRAPSLKVVCVMLVLATSLGYQSHAVSKNGNGWGKGGKKQNSTTLTDSTSTSTTLTDSTSTSTTLTSTAEQTGSADLSWVAPTTRDDGSPLLPSEIAGYVLYYGPEQGGYNSSVRIDDPSTTSLTVTDLPAGTYYFVVTARDTTGNESDYSGIVSRQVP
jgi:hypothetical protein